MGPTSATGIVCAEGVEATPSQIAASKVFRDWLTRTRIGGIRVESVRVVAAHRYVGSPEIRAIDLVATAYKEDETTALPGISFLRGDAVDIFTVLRTPDGQRYVALVDQPRVAGAHAHVRSNPSGMVEGDETPISAAVRELGEELGNTTLKWVCPFDPDHLEPHDLMGGLTDIYIPNLVSPGVNDERVTHLAAMAEVTHEELEDLQRRFTSTEGEDITVLVVPLAKLFEYLIPLGGSADEKTITGALLYALNAEAKVYEI